MRLLPLTPNLRKLSNRFRYSRPFLSRRMVRCLYIVVYQATTFLLSLVRSSTSGLLVASDTNRSHRTIKATIVAPVRDGWNTPPPLSVLFLSHNVKERSSSPPHHLSSFALRLNLNIFVGGAGFEPAYHCNAVAYPFSHPPPPFRD